MAKVVQLKGINKVLSNLKKANKTLGKRVEIGLTAGGLLLQRFSQEIVPVDKNVLRPSARTRKVSGDGFETDIVVSYSTLYAVFVHEDSDAKHKEGKSWKYLEKPAKQRRPEVFAEIGRAALR